MRKGESKYTTTDQDDAFYQQLPPALVGALPSFMDATDDYRVLTL